MIPFLLFLVAVQVGLPLLLYLARNSLLFFPSAAPLPEAGLRFFSSEVEAQLVRLRRPDGRSLAAYDARPRGRGDDAGPVIVFHHGNAGNLGSRAPLLDFFVRETGLRTLLFDYSGYGGNPGRPSEAEVYRDGLAACDHLIAAGIAPEHIVLYGESLGSAVALYVATERPVAGVVLQSSFASGSSLAARFYGWLPLAAVLSQNVLPNARRIADLRVPILIAHGTEDEVIPFAEGEKLHRIALAARESPMELRFLAVPGAGHNDFFEVAGREYLEEVGATARRWVGEGEKSQAPEP